MRSRLLPTILVLGLACMTLAPSNASAWGKDGHDIVGRVADKHLTSRARNAIDELLQDHQFRSLADGRLPTWADSIRSSSTFRKKYPKMAQWHYIDVSIDTDLAMIDLKNFCEHDNCVLGAIKKFKTIVKDPAKPMQDRREALFFIAHFIGDLHQPLHCAERNNDKGGNMVKVHVAAGDRHVTNLHKVWDTELVEEAVGQVSLADYATRLTNSLSTERRKAFQKGTLEDWILESHKLARTKVYLDKGQAIPANGDPHTLSGDYILEGAEIVEEQLTKGGVRLAQFLNEAFKD